MKQKIVGVFFAGRLQAQLVIRGGEGGTFWLNPEVGAIPRIKIGADYTEFQYVLEALLHEVQELVYLQMSLRYTNDNYYGTGADRFVFHMTHAEFSEATNRTSEFVEAAYKPLKKAWKKWHKSKR